MAHHISDTDHAIIQQLRKNARISNTELAKSVHLSEAQCLRRVRALERTKIIQQYTVLVNLPAANLPVMGIVEVRVGSPSKSTMADFESAMNRMESITACWHMSGDANYLMSTSVQNLPEYQRVLNELVAMKRVSIIRSLLVLDTVKTARPITPATLGTSRHKGTESHVQASVGRGSERAPIADAGAVPGAQRSFRGGLDDFNRWILEVLTDNGRIHNVELARRIGLSPSACLRRVRAMEKAGVIRNYGVVYDTDALNLVVAVIHVQLDREDRQLQRLFERQLGNSSSQLTTAFRTNGESDYVLVVEAPSLNSLDRLLLESCLVHPGVKSVHSAIRLRNCFDRTSRLRGVVLPTNAS